MSNVQITISLYSSDLLVEELQVEVENLLQQVKEMEGVEGAELVPVEEVPEPGESLPTFSLGILKINVNPANLKAVFSFLSNLSDRFYPQSINESGRSWEAQRIELSVKVQGREVKIEASSQSELDRAYQKAVEFLREEREDQLFPTRTRSNVQDWELYDEELYDEELLEPDIETTVQVGNIQTPQSLIRYPNLDCPDKAIINQKFSLTVELLRENINDTLQAAIMLEIPDTGTSELPEVEVVLSAPEFDLESSNVQVIKVKRDDDSQVRFNLIPRQLGEQRIRVEFWDKRGRIGTTHRNVLIAQKLVDVTVPQSDESLLLELKTARTVPPQDLDLLIDYDSDKKTLLFRLHSSKVDVNYNYTKAGQVTLEGSPLEKMQVIYEQMSSMANTVPTTQEGRKEKEDDLTNIGNSLWDQLISEPLKQEYWEFKTRVKSLLITSEEPWIPWEMIKPYRNNENGDVEQEPFWCQQFALSRWLSMGGTADEMIIGKVRPIAPTPTNLRWAKEELLFIEQLSTLCSGITPLTTFGKLSQVLDCFTNEEFSLLHFACHGKFDAASPNDSPIELSDGELLRPSHIKVQFKGRRPRPMIFINSCHGARGEFSFTGLGGWAEKLVKARVGAFIGAMWEVSDELALQFAKTFYTKLLKENESIAESFRLAREDIRKAAPYNSTWLAYSLYADAEGRVKVLPS
ncbi:CHAT domain-containing protein [Microcoleus sp. Pol11C1]|uniref:CHAT domain-containing protein n=1 Tax=unclassified Microcoleus TaxID=2642155 RepID=UPI002FCF29DA